MEVELTQGGKDCPLKVVVRDYEGLGELGDALRAGMTPVVSYWSSEDMLWMDGRGSDGQGPCGRDDASACTDSVRFYGFCVSRIGEECSPSTDAALRLPTPAPTAAPVASSTVAFPSTAAPVEHASEDVPGSTAQLATCPGVFKMSGYGLVSMVPTGWGSGYRVPPFEVAQGSLRPHMGARAYFADSCTAGMYSNGDYIALELLGKTLRYTADVSGAGCDCRFLGDLLPFECPQAGPAFP
jgi:hypothetical protein